MRKQSTGEPYPLIAHVRFGGRGGAKPDPNENCTKSSYCIFLKLYLQGFYFMNREFFNRLRTAQEQGIFLDFIRESAESGILFEAMPQLRGLNKISQDPRWHPEGDVWTHTLLVIQNLPPGATLALSMAALLHDVGKSSTTVILESGRITAHGHEAISERIAGEILDALGADDQLKKEVAFLVRNHMIAHSKDANAKTLRRLVREGGRSLVDRLLQHGVADVAGGCQDFTDCRRLRLLFENLTEVVERHSTILNGDEIIELTGLKPGPEVGRLMRALSNLGKIDRDFAVKFLKDRNF